MIKNDKGIALASLIVTVIVMLTITGTITYTSLDTLQLRRLDDMYNDIKLLNQKMSDYYVDNEELPVLEPAIHKLEISKDEKLEKVLNPNDGPYYYIINLDNLSALTLKYGKEFREYSEDSDKKDVYIINDVTKTIYYLKGIEYKLEDGTEGKKYTLEEENKSSETRGIPIPDGFYYVGGDIETGFVISDNKADENKGADYANLTGSQFVWIPVSNFDEFKRYNWENWNENSNLELMSGTTEPEFSEENCTEESRAMYQSVKIYGGFYIARYEAGYEGERGDKEKIVSKNVDSTKVYGNLEEESMDFDDSVDKARDMYNVEEKYGAISTLCYGVQWDATMKYLSDVKKDGISYIISTKQPEENEVDVAKNIYNISKGVYEWTMEEKDGDYRIVRGSASSEYNEIESSATTREEETRDNSGNTQPLGFRVALYIRPVPKDISIPIPDGFYYVGGDIIDGFVISDNKYDEGMGENAKLYGNQFVWIPVNDYKEFKRYDWENWNATTKPNELTNAYTDEINEELQKSVKLYGGFYIGRNEVYNGENITLKDAKETAESMYPRENSEYGAISTLCYGVQWDAAMNYLSDVKDEDGLSYIISTKQPEENEEDVAKNIYNMSKGVYEWTMEEKGEDYRIIRGSASSEYNINESSATAREEETADNKGDTQPLGFRVALYIKL